MRSISYSYYPNLLPSASQLQKRQITEVFSLRAALLNITKSRWKQGRLVNNVLLMFEKCVWGCEYLFSNQYLSPIGHSASRWERASERSGLYSGSEIEGGALNLTGCKIVWKLRSWSKLYFGHVGRYTFASSLFNILINNLFNILANIVEYLSIY